MDSKKSKIRSALSRSRYLFILMAAMLVIIAFIKPVLAIPAAVMLIAAVIMNVLDVRNEEKTLISDYFEDLAGEMDESIISSVLHNPFPLCMIGSDGKIVWCNKQFENLFPEDDGPVDKDICDITGIKLFGLSNDVLMNRIVTIPSIKRSFRVQTSEAQLPDSRKNDRDSSDDEYDVRMFHWLDVTDLEQIKKTYQDEKSCVVHIKVDNLDDILESAPDEIKVSLAGEIEKIIRTWAVKSRAAVIRISKSRYTVICDRRALENTEINKFHILDEVRALNTGGDIPASLSIGAGALGKSLNQTDEFAQAALDLALGRGGDQAVVRKDTSLEYYGGKLQTVGKRNKGKSRIVAIAMLDFIDQSGRVFIMGHKNPDMDAFGAAIGLARIAKTRDREKEVYIVINSWDSVDMPYKLAVETNDYHFISGEQAKLMAEPSDLMIVADTHRPSLTECGEMADIVNKTIIIDHHRRSPDIIKNAVLMHIEPYASSTCELVTEMLQYTTTEKKGISDFEAEVLLAGIVLDTKNFSVKTGVRTFEAASWLRRQGADPAVVRQFFQTDMEVFQKKAEIITRAERLPYNIAISYLAEPRHNVSVLIAMAADSLLDIRGMKASFVIGVEDTGLVRISARSLGAVNVQMILEKLGGGGNLTTAGAQLHKSIRDAQIELVKAIDEYMESYGQKKEAPKSPVKQLRDTLRIPRIEQDKK
ncbi:MAG: DHH family phosphoesterase [Anaerovoracaceae bacterium]|nr:DHH family phosphoesterase [Bacillota bacterium]MDY2670715.1 DHH family phosphoesterase [Anaerovoracaceae bacterium]